MAKHRTVNFLLKRGRTEELENSNQQAANTDTTLAATRIRNSRSPRRRLTSPLTSQIGRSRWGSSTIATNRGQIWRYEEAEQLTRETKAATLCFRRTLHGGSDPNLTENESRSNLELILPEEERPNTTSPTLQRNRAPTQLPLRSTRSGRYPVEIHRC
ncbi:hypothetical protein Bca101_018788 [Brassica carinata]